MDVTGGPADGAYPDDPGPEDRWIIARLGGVASEVDRLLDEFRLSDAYAVLYNFAWSEVFDWYLEMAKAISVADPERQLAMRNTLGAVTRDVLKLFHPVIPFVTEELWSHLGDGSTLMISAPWPRVPSMDAPSEMDSLQCVVAGIRQFRSQHQIGRKVEMPVTVAVSGDQDLPKWWYSQVSSLTGASPRGGSRPDPIAGHTRISCNGVEAYIALEGLVDVEAEKPRIEKAIAELESGIARARSKLENPSFRDRAPAEVVAQEEVRLENKETELAKQRQHLDELG
jgi:valyl-tRNA synthetase